MDYIFLPEKIRKELENSQPGRTAAAILRAGGAPEGIPGESYVVIYTPEIYLFYRNLGENDYHNICHNILDDGVPEFKIRHESFNIFLDTVLKGRKFSLKFSSFDEAALLAAAAKLGSRPAEPAKIPVPAVQTQRESPLHEKSQNSNPAISPFAGLAALLMYESLTDGTIDAAEDEYIRKLFERNQDSLHEGLAYFKAHGADELFTDIAYLNRQQSLCCLAHLFESGMADGSLRSTEQKFIRKFADAMRIEDDELTAVRDVLLIKNQISVMF